MVRFTDTRPGHLLLELPDGRRVRSQRVTGPLTAQIARAFAAVGPGARDRAGDGETYTAYEGAGLTVRTQPPPLCHPALPGGFRLGDGPHPLPFHRIAPLLGELAGADSDDPQTLASLYKAVARTLHPDPVNGDRQVFQLLQAAYRLAKIMGS
ncbi:hypothetical protein ACIBEA_39180 [Streptomyces sp. NPDC051555]|uniref:hypothetical protein n=1 Tax=Streptomyces sp. NPDC051555 TaxID=3365657 RepID=UPI0037B22E63